MKENILNQKGNRMRTIYFDMDGTIADLYGVCDWENKLRNEDPSPYAVARVMKDSNMLARMLNKLQEKGYKIGIISWLSKNSSNEYERKVERAKIRWLQQHFTSVVFDEIHLLKYGSPKQLFRDNENDILFDDSDSIRETWGEEAYTPGEIFFILKELLHNGD